MDTKVRSSKRRATEEENDARLEADNHGAGQNKIMHKRMTKLEDAVHQEKKQWAQIQNAAILKRSVAPMLWIDS